MFLKYVVPKDNKSELILFWKLEGFGWEYFERGCVHSFLVHVRAPAMHTQRDHCSQHAPQQLLNNYRITGAKPHVGTTEGKTPETLHRDSLASNEKHQPIVSLNWRLFGDHSENILFFYVLTVFWLRDFWRPDFLGTFFL